MDHRKLERLTAILLNSTTIVALIVGGVWTMYQWNVTIFPKESFEEFKRKSLKRIDLQILNSSSLDLRLTKTDTTEDGVIEYNYRVDGKLMIKNEKDFPIFFRMDSVEFGLLGREKKEISPGIMIWKVNRDEFFKVAPLDFFGTMPSDLILEPEGSLKQSFTFDFLLTGEVVGRVMDNLKVEMAFLLYPVDPKDGKIVDVPKRKSFVIEGDGKFFLQSWYQAEQFLDLE
jgi:hypothetical protein